MTGHHSTRRRYNSRNLGNRRIFKVLGIGHRNFNAADARYWRVKLVEGVFHDPRHDLGRDAAALPTLIDDHRTMRSAHGVNKGCGIQRPQSAQVDDFSVDAFAGDLFRGLERFK